MLKHLPDDLVNQIRPHLAGLPEADALTVLARIVNPAIVRSCVDTPPRGETFTTPVRLAMKEQAVALSAGERAQIRSLGHAPEEVEAEIVKLREERAARKRSRESVELTAADRDALTSLGLDPEEVLCGMRAADAGDYQRLRKEAVRD